MPDHQSRAEFLRANRRARAWAALELATAASVRTEGWIRLPEGSLEGKTVAVLGAGVGGLTAAYEMLAHGARPDKVILLEAQNRTGGRCLTLRTGDTLIMDEDSKLWDSQPGETQVVRFKRPLTDSEPYLNAGPGRIPSGHKHLLSYLKDFGVELEIYVMNSGANLVAMEEGPLADRPYAYRRLDHNTRGWLSQWVYTHAEQWVDERLEEAPSAEDRDEWVRRLRDLMVSFGDLTEDGEYAETPGEPGLENARSRAGFDVLPGVSAGSVPDALTPEELLESEFWKQTRFYQPQDFLWQPTLFQPVGGMDRVEHAFAQQVTALGAEIRLNSPVERIDFVDGKFEIHVSKIGTEEPEIFHADHCISNIAMPFLQEILSDRLQNEMFEKPFREGLKAVYAAQSEGWYNERQGYTERFLANTTKVGWYADRDLWQGITFTERNEHLHDEPCRVAHVHESEQGVVPIFGGISWTSHEITQIWYPSTAYHDEMGVLTGAYNFGRNALEAGKMPIKKRLELAKAGARLFGEDFAEGLDLDTGIAIAWQRMPHIKGGWAQWHVLQETLGVDKAVEHYNALTRGTLVADTDAKFLVVGDQVSSLPGWQEGAITAALNAISRMARWDVEPVKLTELADTRLTVEGV